MPHSKDVPAGGRSPAEIEDKLKRTLISKLSGSQSAHNRNKRDRDEGTDKGDAAPAPEVKRPRNSKSAPVQQESTGPQLRPGTVKRRLDIVKEQRVASARLSKTRAGSKLRKELEDGGEDPAEMQAAVAKRTPPKELANGSKIFCGDRSFSKEFSERFWILHVRAAGPEKRPICTGSGGCGKEIPVEEQSIDHKTPWSDLMGGCDPLVVCKDGAHWEVVLQEEARRVSWDGQTDVSTFTDLGQCPNLIPKHKGCNSAKGGTKGNDPVIPKYLGDCPNPGECNEPKAI